MLRDRVDIVRSNGVILLESPIVGRCCCENGIGAKVVGARAAVVASPAGHAGLDGNTIADSNVLHLLAYLNDGACAFVAQDDWAVEDKVADAAALPVMNIAPTDASLFDVDADVVFISKTWDRTVFKGDVPDGLENKSAVLEICLVSSG